MKNIVIVGAGTAGVLSAAICRKIWKYNANVSVYYDSQKKCIGVGESVAPGIIEFLDDLLGLSIEDILRISGTTLKLGIRHKNWIPNDEYFHGLDELPEGDHDDHDHDKKEKEHGHDEHGHDADHKKEGHDDHGHEGHAHGEFDPHIWLDPMNAKVILSEMAEHLIENDQKNEPKYKANLKKAHKDLDKLTKKVKSELNKDFKSIVFHDAYQYFEERFGINILGAFTVNTDVMPGAEQLAEIREIIEHDKVSCIFSEPQFNPDIIKAVAKDTNVATGVIDPLGATLNPGKDLYFDLISNMSKSFKGC